LGVIVELTDILVDPLLRTRVVPKLPFVIFCVVIADALGHLMLHQLVENLLASEALPVRQFRA
jgi:hypothetical protein